MSLSFIICYWWVVLVATKGCSNDFAALSTSVLFWRALRTLDGSVQDQQSNNGRSSYLWWPLCARPRVYSLTKQKHIVYDFRICRVVELSSTKVSAGLYILQPPSSLQPGARRRGVPCRDDRTSLKATTPACRAASDLWFTGSVIAVSWLGEEPTATAASTARPSAPEADRLRFDHRSIISSWNVALTPEILAR